MIKFKAFNFLQAHIVANITEKEGKISSATAIIESVKLLNLI